MIFFPISLFSLKNVLLSSLKMSHGDGFNKDNNIYFVAKYRK